jgi:hypothetical protein
MYYLNSILILMFKLIFIYDLVMIYVIVMGVVIITIIIMVSVMMFDEYFNDVMNEVIYKRVNVVDLVMGVMDLMNDI